METQYALRTRRVKRRRARDLVALSEVVEYALMLEPPPKAASDIVAGWRRGV
jgi:hypothetical protein